MNNSNLLEQKESANHGWLQRFVRGRNHVTLYNADCLDVIELLPAIDAVITDPPYGIAYQHSGGGRSPKWNRNNTKAVHGDDEPFDPVFKVGDKSLRICKIKLEKKKITALLLPLPDAPRPLSKNKTD